MGATLRRIPAPFAPWSEALAPGRLAYAFGRGPLCFGAAAVGRQPLASEDCQTQQRPGRERGVALGERGRQASARILAGGASALVRSEMFRGDGRTSGAVAGQRGVAGGFGFASRCACLRNFGWHFDRRRARGARSDAARLILRGTSGRGRRRALGSTRSAGVSDRRVPADVSALRWMLAC